MAWAGELRGSGGAQAFTRGRRRSPSANCFKRDLPAHDGDIADVTVVCRETALEAVGSLHVLDNFGALASELEAEAVIAEELLSIS